MSEKHEKALRAAGYAPNAAGMWEHPSIGEDGVSDPVQLCEMLELEVPPTKKFIVRCQCYVEEIADIEVEADTYQQAVQEVMDNDLMLDADWQAGSDTCEPEIYLVVDEKGATVWDRNIDDDLEGELARITQERSGDD